MISKIPKNPVQSQITCIPNQALHISVFHGASSKVQINGDAKFIVNTSMQTYHIRNSRTHPILFALQWVPFRIPWLLFETQQNKQLKTSKKGNKPENKTLDSIVNRHALSIPIVYRGCPRRHCTIVVGDQWALNVNSAYSSNRLYRRRSAPEPRTHIAFSQ